MTQKINGARLLCWIAVLLAAAWFTSSRLQFSYDLSQFLPAPKTLQQHVLLESLQRGNNTRFLYIGLRDPQGEPIDEDKLEVAQEILQNSGIFASVTSAVSALSLQPDDAPLIQQYRYLLHDSDWSAAALREELLLRKDDLQFVNGESFTRLIASDPTLAIRAVFEGLQPNSADSEAQEDQWRSENGYDLLLAETVAPAFDVEAQQKAYRETLGLLATQPEFEDTEIAIAGIGAISAQMASMIRDEAVWRSILASVLLLLVLLLAYQKPMAIFIAGLPLATACITGAALLSVLFPTVHGITLAFGFTLLGVAIDYPLHLLSHARQQPLAHAARAIWPTLLLGMCSTVLVYLAMAFSGSYGLMQLGLFTAAGIVAAALSTRYLLPQVMPTLQLNSLDASPDASSQIAAAPANNASRLSFFPLAVLLGITLLATGIRWVIPAAAEPSSLWNNNLSALSPVPKEQLALDQQFRKAIGAADARNTILVAGADLEAVLRNTEKLDAALAESVSLAGLSGWTAATRLLPSQAMQQARKDAIPTVGELRDRVATASQASGFSKAAFTEFIEAAEASRELPLVTYDALATSAVGEYLQAHLYEVDGEWRSLFTLYGLQDPAQLRQWLADNFPEAMLVDYKASSEQLVQNYRHRVLITLSVALLVVGIALLIGLSSRRALWCLGIVCCVLPCTAWLLFLAQGALDLYHLIALILVAGLGLDYTLFRSRPSQNAEDSLATRHAVFACAASTISVFATLGFSSLPALSSMGQCVALGSLLCLLLAWLGSRDSVTV